MLTICRFIHEDYCNAIILILKCPLFLDITDNALCEDKSFLGAKNVQVMVSKVQIVSQ